MSIERELQRNYQEVFYPPMPEPEVQVAAAPTETVTDVNQPAFTMPGMGKRKQKSEVGQNLPIVAADVAAGGVKGLFSGVGGFGGDIQALYQGVKGVINRGGDERALDAFLRGMAQETILPTSDEVSKWLDKNIGPVVPAGANMSPEMIKARQAGANAGEFAGQFVADPFAAIGAGKAIVKGAKALPKNLPVGMSTQAVDGMEGVLQPAAKAAAQPSDIGFYSAVEQAALNIQRKSGTGQAMLNDITKGENVKADEIKWIGLDDFLKGKKNVSKEEVQQFIAANKVDVQEVTLGGDFKPITDPQEAINYLAKEKGLTPEQLVDEYGYINPNDYVTLANDVAQPAPSKFGAYTLPGGENYREILLTMPSKQPAPTKETFNIYNAEGRMVSQGIWPPSERAQQTLAANPGYRLERGSIETDKPNDFTSSHWDEKNVLAHIRVNDRVDADGKKMLLIEEVQSDWHQAGRDKGYGSEPQYAQGMEGNPEGFLGVKQGVPDAPMKDTWYQLALKRALKYAADNGYERVGLTTGSRQAERYDLSKQISSVMLYTEPGAEMGVLRALDNHGDAVIKERIKVSTLSDYIGKEAAKKLLDQSPSVNGKTGLQTELRTLNGVDLQVGGEGMKKYYDEIYPQFLAKYGKKWGAKVGETTIPTGRSQDASGIPSMYPNKEPVRYIDITPQMKESVSKGQPLFSATGLATGAGAGTMATSQQEPQ